MQITQKPFLKILPGIVLITLLAGCGPAGNPQNPVREPSTEVSAPDVTTIVIDGDGDDWIDRPLLHEDEIGDAEGEFLDIGKVYAFVNQDALYVLMEVVDPAAPFVQIDFEVNTDKGVHYFGWRPESGPPNPYSSFALGSVFEGRIDLRDIGQPEKIVRLTELRVMVGQEHPSPEWRAADIWNSGVAQVVMVDEIDEFRVDTVLTQEGQGQAQEQQTTSVPEPDEFISSEPLEERAKYVWLEERGEYADYLYRQFHQNAQQVAWGPDGYLYIADGSGKHIVRVAPDGTLDDLGIWKNHIYMQEYGPNAIAFDLDGNLLFNTGPHLYKRFPDGSIEYMFTAIGYIRSLAIDNAGLLYYSLASNQIFQWNPNGDDILLTDEYRDPQITIGPESQLFISDHNGDRIIILDLDTKETSILAEGIFGPEGQYIRVDADGDVWVRGTPFGMQLSPEGEKKPFTIDGQSGDNFRWHLAGDIVFDPEGNLWVTYASGEIVRLTPVDPKQPDPDAFTSEVIYQSFEASDIDVAPDGSIYATNNVPGNIWRFDPDGSYEIIWEHGDQGRVGIAVTADGVIYAGTIFGEILKMEDGRISHYATLYTERMVIGGDGYLYAVEGRWGEDQRIVRIPAPDTIEVVATEIDGVPLGTTPVQIAPAQDHGLYVVNQSYGLLYYLDFGGEGYVLKDFGAEMQYTIIGSSPINGKVYLLAHLLLDHNTILNRYTLYEFEPGGELTVVSPVIPGDPWGMDVSPDGKWLYVIEVGAVDRIPLDDGQ